MLKLDTKNQMVLPAKTNRKEENNANPVILYLPEGNHNEEKEDKAFLFQGNSGKIFINLILYSVFSLSKKTKKAMHEIGQKFFWRIGDITRFFKNGNLWKYIPARVFALAMSCGAVAIFMIDAGIMSEVVYGSEAKYQAYSAVSESIKGDVIIKKVGKNIEDKNLAVIVSKQCANDYKNSQNSEMCGVNIKNKVLEKAERDEELARLAAARAEAARKAAASRVSVGRVSCPEKNDGHPSKSSTKGKHMDEDCCPDPDEWPKPGCVYSPHGYSIMLKGPAKKK